MAASMLDFHVRKPAYFNAENPLHRRDYARILRGKRMHGAYVLEQPFGDVPSMMRHKVSEWAVQKELASLDEEEKERHRAPLRQPVFRNFILIGTQP